MQITSGKIQSAQKIVIYGPEGIGKSTFASKFPNPVFCDTEGSTKHMDVQRVPKPTSWTAILEQVRYFIKNPHLLGTFVLDTADWAERLCTEEVCAKAQKSSIEDFGYGKGFTYLTEEFGRLLNLLEELVEKGVHVAITAHAKMRKFEQPDELGAYDRWEMKLSKTTAPLLKEWADIVLFASYKTYVVNVDDRGAAKGKNKVQGGQRVMRTAHHPCWDAKNRHGLPDELPFDYAKIAHIFPQDKPITPPAPPAAPPAPEPSKEVPKPEPEKPAAPPAAPPQEQAAVLPTDDIPPALADLMKQNGVTSDEIRFVVSLKGYYPQATPISKYDPDFVKGVLIAAWPQVLGMILKERETVPF